MPPLLVPVKTMLAPTQLVAELLLSCKVVAGGWLMKNTSLIWQPVKASVTVTLHKPALKVLGWEMVKVLSPLLHR